MTFERKQRVVVAMSGGVDSSVTAALLAERGFEVIGMTMRLYGDASEDAERPAKSCCGSEDVEDARETCRIIGAKHYYLNLQQEFSAAVIRNFIAEYERGRTPYPCLVCNDRMKFDFLLKRARLLGADYLATGHYARIVENADGTRSLVKGIDPAKDQSYALYNLTQSLLRRLMFPIGEFTKDETRALAERYGLPIATKPESQDICFIPTGNYREFVSSRIRNARSGAVVGTDGQYLGDHGGVHNFTIGQRHGIPGTGSLNRPTYVTSIDADSGEVTVGSSEELMSTEFIVSGLNWISGSPPDAATEFTASVRYRAPSVPARVEQLTGEQARITLEKPVRAVTPGQAVVFYADDAVLGGATIESSVPASKHQRISRPQRMTAQCDAAPERDAAQAMDAR